MSYVFLSAFKLQLSGCPSHLASDSFLRFRFQKIWLYQKQNMAAKKMESYRIWEMTIKNLQMPDSLQLCEQILECWVICVFWECIRFREMTEMGIWGHLRWYRLAISLEIVSQGICHIQWQFCLVWHGQNWSKAIIRLIKEALSFRIHLVRLI